MTPPDRETTALVVEDHALLAQTMGAGLSLGGVRVVHARLRGREDLLEQARACAADVVLLDLDLPACVGPGEELVTGLRATGAVVLVLTGSDDPERHARCLLDGAAAVLPKRTSFPQLAEAVRLAAAGAPVMAQDARLDVLRRGREASARRERLLAPFTRLSPRESLVLGCVMSGMTVSEVAAEAVVSVATVRTQVRSILNKLGVQTQLAAVTMAHEAGWRPPAG